jgi:endonuclease G
VDSLDPEKKEQAKEVLNKLETNPNLDVIYLQYARAAASSVGRVIYEQSKKPWGTATMISDRLLLTNWHVISSKTHASDLLIEFNYEKGIFGRCKVPTRFKFAPDEFYFCNVKLDFAIVAVKETSVTGKVRLSEFGYVPLSASGDKHIKGDFANMIQHPLGDFKRIALRENRIWGRFGLPPDPPGRPIVLYPEWNTDHGSSGSAIFNDQFWIIGVHHGEGFTKDILDEDQRREHPEIPPLVGVASRASAIVSDVKERRNQIAGSRPDLIDLALNCGFKGPSLIEQERREILA